MDNKKISFGFNKIVRKNEIVVVKAPKEERPVELIECLEGQSIKIKNAVKEIKEPLVIPMKDSSSQFINRIREVQERRIKKEVKEEPLEAHDSQLSLDELAARELIREAQARHQSSTDNPKIYALPINEETLEDEGKAEATLDDYENVPISGFGMAMLRGMGWKEGSVLGRNPSKSVTPVVPELRPRGMGLGANKMVIAETPKKAVDKDGKELTLVKGAYSKIIAGSHKGEYCQVQGFDEGSCRVIVKAVSGDVLTLNEFLLVPVTKEKYNLGSKVINNAKYEEYKEISDRKLKQERQSPSKEEAGSSNHQHTTRRIKQEQYRSNSSDSAHSRNGDSASKRKDHKYKEHKDRHKHKISKTRHRTSSSDSDSDSESDSDTNERKRDRGGNSKSSNKDYVKKHEKKSKKSRKRSRSRDRQKSKKDKSKKRSRRDSNSDSELDRYEKSSRRSRKY